MKRFLSTDDSWAGLVVRLTVGLVIFPHGAQKLFGWFGGQGLSSTLGFFSGQLGIPTPIALLVIIAESLGALALVAGFLTRASALGLATVMLGAIFMAHLPNGFFMNWFGNQRGEGFEYHLLVIGMTLALAVVGAGRFSLDGWLARRLDERRSSLEPVPAE
jgi:putative oxidoreductase